MVLMPGRRHKAAPIAIAAAGACVRHMQKAELIALDLKGSMQHEACDALFKTGTCPPTAQWFVQLTAASQDSAGKA